MKSRILLVAAVLCIAALGFPRQSSALSIVPPTLEFATQPGQTVTGKIKVFNNDKKFQTFFLTTSNFVAGGENGEPDFDFKDDLVDLADWIKLDAKKLELQPDGEAVINVTIEVPKNADPGGHYAGVFLSTTSPEGGNVQVENRTGTLIIVRVDGNVRESATVKELTTASGKTTLNRLPVDLILRIQNTGNVHFRPKGIITIRNMFGGVTSTIDINPKEGAVLPNSARRFEMVWERTAQKAKAGGFFTELSNEWNNFAFGGYTAELSATYGTSNQTLISTFHMTVFPWRVLLIATLLIIAAIVLIVWLVKRYNSAIIKRAQVVSGKTTDKRPPEK